MKDLLDHLSDEECSRIRNAALPDWVPPMLATLTHEPFSDPGWICGTRTKPARRRRRYARTSTSSTSCTSAATT